MIVREVDYTFYQPSEPFGNPGDLKTAIVKDEEGAIDTTYYRYYQAGDANGYAHGLKYVFGPASFDCLQQALGDPSTLADGQVAPFADYYLEYDSARRVTRQGTLSAIRT